MNAPAERMIGTQEAHSFERRVRRVYLFSIAIWGLDYKAAVSGDALALQGLILALFVGCLIWLVRAAVQRNAGPGRLWVLLMAAVLFALDSALVGVLNGQQVYRVIANLVPFGVYIAASVATYVTLSMLKDDTHGFLDGLRLACLISGVLHFLVTYVTRGNIDLSTSRYEVLSGAVVPSLGILPLGLSQRLSLMDFVVLLLNLVLAVVSVTRTLVIALAVQMAAVLVSRPSIVLRREMQRGVVLALLVGAIIVGLDFAAGTGLTTRWVDRLTMSERLGSDPSGLSRISETHYMWHKFTSSPETVVFGNGIAAVTSLMGRENVREEMLIGKTPLKQQLHSSGIGHENYVSILYVAGLLGGGLLLVIQFLNAIQSLVVIRTLQNRPSPYRTADAHLGVWAGIILLGMLTLGFLGPVFQDRDECLWLGVGTGMLYWARAMIARAKSTDS